MRMRRAYESFLHDKGDTEMTENQQRHGRSKAGVELTDEVLERMAGEAEDGLAVTKLRRRPGRPAMGSGRADTLGLDTGSSVEAGLVALLGFVIAATVWWVYFDRWQTMPGADARLASCGRRFIF